MIQGLAILIIIINYLTIIEVGDKRNCGTFNTESISNKTHTPQGCSSSILLAENLRVTKLK